MVFGGEEKRMDIVDGSCKRRKQGDQSEGCLCVARRPLLERGRAHSRGKSVGTGDSAAAGRAKSKGDDRHRLDAGPAVRGVREVRTWEREGERILLNQQRFGFVSGRSSD